MTPPAEDDLRRRVDELARRQEGSREVLSHLLGRIVEIERGLGREPKPLPPHVLDVMRAGIPPAPAVQPAAPVAARPPVPAVEARPAPAPPPAPPSMAPPWPLPPREATPPVPAVTPRPAVRPAEPEPPEESLEARIGGRWFNWAGILALLVGLGALMKYSFDQGWISHPMRFGGGILVGLLMGAGGSLAQARKLPVFARGLWGGGLGVLYLTLFAGFQVLHGPLGGPLVSQNAAFAGMIVTTLLGAGLSIAYSTRTVAALASIGGFLTPILVSTGVVQQSALGFYLAILSAGFLALGAWKQWHFLGWTALPAVIVYAPGWALPAGYDPSLSVAFALLFLALFGLEPLLKSALPVREPSASLAARLLLSFLVFGSGGLFLVRDHFPAVQGLYLLTLASSSFAASILARRRRPADAVVPDVYGSVAALAFLLVPWFEPRIPSAHISTVTALQAAALFAGSMVRPSPVARASALVGLFTAAAVLYAWATPEFLTDLPAWRPLLNERLLAYGVLTAVFGLVLWAYRRVEAAKGTLPDGERTIHSLALIVGTSLPVAFLSLEIREALLHWIPPQGAAYPAAPLSALVLSTLWIAYAALVATVSRRRSESPLLVTAIAFLVVAVFKLVGHDLLGTPLNAHAILLNPRFLAVAASTACLAWLGREFRFDEPGRISVRPLAPVFVVAAHVLGQLAVSFDWLDFWDGSAYGGLRVYGIAAILALHAAALWADGIRRDRLHLRGTALLFVGVAFVLVLGAAAALGRGHPSEFLANPRFLGGAAVTGSLLAGAAMYRGWGSKIRRPVEIGDRRLDETVVAPLAILGHLLMLVLLTLEVGDWVDGHPRIDTDHGRQMAYSLLWTTYGVGLVAFGMISRFRPIRLFALLLMMATILKVFLVDLSFLEGLYRILSFIGLGIVLVGVSFLYQRFKKLVLEA